jgi:hypothetical protein
MQRKPRTLMNRVIMIAQGALILAVAATAIRAAYLVWFVL